MNTLGRNYLVFYLFIYLLLLLLFLFLFFIFCCGAATQRVSWPPHSWGF